MPPRTKNVLMIVSDQHPAHLMGCAGDPTVRTPNLDALARDGVRFDQAYCQNPICTPSRMSMLSGQYPHNHGHFGLAGPAPRALPSLFRHFRRHGYRTAGIGKLHLPDTPRNWIADDVDLFADCYRTIDGRPGESIYFDYLDRLGLRDVEDSRAMPEARQWGATHDSRPSNMPFEHSVEMWCVKQARDFIDRCEDEPFFMQVSLPRPHHQLTPDRRFWDMYDDDLPPPRFDADSSHRPPHFRRKVDRFRTQERWLFEPRTFDAGIRRVWRGTRACITQVDHAIGHLLEHIRTRGVESETVVIYTSDHGAYHGQLGLPEKAPGICSDLVCRVPFIWRVPGVTQPGHVASQLVETIDIASTVTRLCHLPDMETCDGSDLSLALLGDSTRVKEVAVTENPWSKSIRWRNWRFVHYPQSLFEGEDVGELYDLDRDPTESRNLYGRDEHRQTVDHMRRLLLDWTIRTTRIATAHPVAGPWGVHKYMTAEDEKESNRAGVRARLASGELDYL